MPEAISVKFWKRNEDARGFSSSEIFCGQFRWRVRDRHFEVVHGISRVALLIPEKLVTTQVVIKALPENFKQEDNGFFLLLVKKLVNVYQDLEAKTRQYLQGLPGADSIVDIDEWQEEYGFGEVAEDDRPGLTLQESIEKIQQLLDSTVESARLCNEALYWEQAGLLVAFSDCLSEVCRIFLDFVHPVLVQSRRHENFEDVRVGEKLRALELKLEQKEKHLQIEFDKLKLEEGF